MTRGSNYGIEAEFTGCYRGEVVDNARGYGVEIRDDGYHHDPRKYWRVTSDGSVTGYDGDDGSELVSPILTMGKPATNATATVLQAIREIGGFADRTCGLHVHHNVSVKKHSKERIINMIRAYCVSQPTIGTILPASRTTREGYCQQISMTQIAGLEQRSMGGRGYGGDRYWNSWSGLDRYYTVNPASYPVHGTIEFRQHSGTLDAAKVNHWVRLTKGFMDFDMHYTVMENALAAARTDEMKLRVMLRLLGMPDDTAKFYLHRQELFKRAQGDEEDRTASEYSDPGYANDYDVAMEHCANCNASGETYCPACDRCHHSGCYGESQSWWCSVLGGILEIDTASWHELRR